MAILRSSTQLYTALHRAATRSKRSIRSVGQAAGVNSYTAHVSLAGAVTRNTAVDNLLKLAHELDVVITIADGAA